MPIYPLDATGRLPTNLTPGETHTIHKSIFGEFNYIIPDAAPFHEYLSDGTPFKIYHVESGRHLVYGTDYVFGHKVETISLTLGVRVFTSILFMDPELEGTVIVDPYQTLGDNWVRKTEDVLALMESRNISPRHTTYEQVLGMPEQLPVLEHLQDWSELKGTEDMIAALDRVRDAILTKSTAVTDLREGIMAEVLGNNPVDEFNDLSLIGRHLSNVPDQHYATYTDEVVMGVGPKDYIKAAVHNSPVVCGCEYRSGDEIVLFLYHEDLTTSRITVDAYMQATVTNFSTNLATSPIACWLDETFIYTIFQDGQVFRSTKASGTNYALLDSSEESVGLSNQYDVPPVSRGATQYHKLTDAGWASANYQNGITFDWLVDDGTDGMAMTPTGYSQDIANSSNWTQAYRTIDLTDAVGFGKLTAEEYCVVRPDGIEILSINGDNLSFKDVLGQSMQDIEIITVAGVVYMNASRTATSRITHYRGVNTRPNRLTAFARTSARPYPVLTYSEAFNHDRAVLLRTNGGAHPPLVDFDRGSRNLLIPI